MQFESPCKLVERRTRRHYIVHDPNRLPCQIDVTFESVTNIGRPYLPGQGRLRSGMPGTTNGGQFQWYPQPSRQGACQFNCLIKTSFDQALRGKRHGQDQIRRCGRRQTDQGLSKKIGAGETATILQRQDKFVGGVSVAIRNNGRVKMFGAPQALTAYRVVRRRQCTNGATLCRNWS